MIKLLTGAAVAAVLLFVLFIESPCTARGQGVGGYRGRQGRKVGRVTLPTPPYNPDAGILNRRAGRRHDSPKVTRRRSTRRSVRNAKPGTSRRRRARRVHDPRHGIPRSTVGDHQ